MMNKIQIRATQIHDRQRSARPLAAAELTLDALDVTGDRAKAALLGRLWQQIATAEQQAEDDYAGITTYGEDVRDMGWELVENKVLPTTPQYGFDTEPDDQEKEPIFEYDSDLLDEALEIMRNAILNQIYEPV